MGKIIINPDTIKLNREEPIPLYQQLKIFLLNKIENKDTAMGDILPTERELKSVTNLSRSTIRQAFEELEREGYVVRRRGVGTIVANKKIIPQLMKLTSFTEDIKKRGLEPTSKTISLDLVIPPQNIKDVLGVQRGEKIWCVKRIRYADGEPIAYQELFIPPTLDISARDLTNLVSYYQLLTEKHNIQPYRASETMHARLVTSSEARLLQISTQTVFFSILRFTFDENGQPIEAVRMLNRGDWYEYQVNLYRQTEHMSNL